MEGADGVALVAPAMLGRLLLGPRPLGGGRFFPFPLGGTGSSSISSLGRVEIYSKIIKYEKLS